MASSRVAKTPTKNVERNTIASDHVLLSAILITAGLISVTLVYTTISASVAFGTYSTAVPKSSTASTVNIAVNRLKSVVRALLLTASVERVSEPEESVLDVNAQAAFAAPSAKIS